MLEEIVPELMGTPKQIIKITTTYQVPFHMQAQF
jgi:hypothetical protein